MTGKRRDAVALLVLLVAGVAAFFVPPLEIDASWEQLIRGSDPLRPTLHRLETDFGAGEGIVAVVEGPASSTVEHARALAREAAAWPEVRAVVGPREGAEVAGTIGADGRTAAVYLEVRAGPRVSREARSVATRLAGVPAPEGVEVLVAGGVVEEIALAEAVLHDQRVLVPFVFLTLVLVGLWMMRGVGGAVILAVVLGTTLVLTVGTYGFLFGGFTSVASLLTPIVMTIAAANAIHLHARYRRERESVPPEEAVRRAWRPAAEATVLATTTTGAGFLALFVMGIPEFGRLAVMGAVGCLWTLVVVIGLMPSLLVRLDRRRTTQPLILPALSRFAEHDLRRRGWGFVVSLVVLLGCGIGITRLTTACTVADQLPTSSPVRRAIEVLDRDLGGASRAEFLWTRPDGFRTGPGLDALRRVRLALYEEIDSVRAVADASAATDAVLAARPGLDERQALAAVESGLAGPLPRMIDADGDTARLILRFQSGTAEDLLERVDRVVGLIDRESGPDDSATPAGADVLIARSALAVVRGQGLAVLLSVLAASLIAAAVLRSWRILPLLWIPNLLPIAAIAGLLGWLDEPVSMSTAVVGSVVFGLVVDDTLHYLAALREEGRDSQAPARALGRLGPAFIATSALLSLGSAVAGLGDAEPVRVFSRLAAVGVLLALVCDLFVAPRLALWWWVDRLGRGSESR